MARFIFEIRYVEAQGKRTIQVWTGEATRVDHLLNSDGDPTLITVFDGPVPVFMVRGPLFESGRVVRHIIQAVGPAPVVPIK